MVAKKEKQFDSPEELEDFMSEDIGDNSVEEEEVFKKPFVPPKKAAKAPEPKVADFPPAVDEDHGDMLDIAADVPLQVVAVMGKKNMALKEIAALKMGGVIELGRPANEVVDLVAGGKLIAKGELVEIEGKLGVRIVKMVR